jgi:predicted nucleotide-binding protein/uncharacterized protein YjbI with pentapeptide repeats
VPYHVRITPKGGQSPRHDALALDKDAGWIEEHITAPRRQGHDIFVDGRVFSWADVEQIHITETDQTVDQLIPKTRARLARSGLISTTPDKWHVVTEGHDVTEQFITGPPGTAARAAVGRATTFAADRKAVMVIYGHDTQANTALFDWLRAIGLQPQEWSQLIHASGNASPYIGQVLDKALQDVQAVIAYFTPDEYVTTAGPPREQSAWRLQARPNVLIEAGMALITHPTRTILAVLGTQELPSDLAGRHYVRLSSADPAPLHDLASRLRDAGCDTNTTGTDWLNPERFPDRTHTTQPPRPGGLARHDKADTLEQSRINNERFTTASAQLADPNPAIRIAGGYAMALLADDWEARRQDCIDVLCTTLRTQPASLIPETQAAGNGTREATRTLIGLITAHLQPDDKRAPVHASWSDCNFDFTGVTFNDADFTGARFNGNTSFRKARFAAGASFGRSEFSGGSVDFDGAEFSSATLSFRDAEFSGGVTYFNSARFTDSTVTFYRARFTGGDITFGVAELVGGLIMFNEADFSAGSVDFSSTKFNDGKVEFWKARFSGARVAFPFARFNGAVVSFRLAEFTSGTVDFGSAHFSSGIVTFQHGKFVGSTVDFSNADFEGGTVDLSNAGDWAKPPVFSYRGQPPHGLRLPPA